MAEPVVNPPDTSSWSDWWADWLDVIRAPVALALVVAAMLTLASSQTLWLFDAASPDAAALMNGAAAIASALAAIIAARRSGVNEQQVADHEARLRVLEDRGTRA